MLSRLITCLMNWLINEYERMYIGIYVYNLTPCLDGFLQAIIRSTKPLPIDKEDDAPGPLLGGSWIIGSVTTYSAACNPTYRLL